MKDINGSPNPRPAGQRPGDTVDATRRRPNIVIILADDLGFSDLGCYGSEVKTPAIDALADRGLRFSQMYNSARCCPSRAALLTGLHPHQAGIGHMTFTASETNPAYQGYLNDTSVTIAEPLRAAGYRTLMSGKWHVARQRPMSQRSSWPDERPGYPLPTDRGFDEFYGTIGGAASYYKPTYLMRNDELIEQEDPSFYYTDAITDNALDMANRAMTDETPFFLYLSYTAPHWPLHALEEDIAKYDGVYAVGWDHLRTARHEELKATGIVNEKWDISARDPGAWPWDEARHPDWEARRMATYAAQIDRMDQGIGRLIAALRERGEIDNTLIFFLSDNGGCAEFMAEDGGILDGEPGMLATTTPEGLPVRFGNTPEIVPGGARTFQSYDICWANASNAPFRRFKRWVHEGGISTPLVIHWPNRIKVPSIVHSPAHIIDLMPTCLEVAEASYPSEFNGQPITPFEGSSLTRFFGGRDRGTKDPLFFEHEGNRAIRDGEWKLVSAEEGQWELYNMDEDRTESHDLSSSEPERVKRMQEEWDSWAARVGVNPDLREDLAELLEAETAHDEAGHRRLRNR